MRLINLTQLAIATCALTILAFSLVWRGVTLWNYRRWPFTANEIDSPDKEWLLGCILPYAVAALIAALANYKQQEIRSALSSKMSSGSALGWFSRVKRSLWSPRWILGDKWLGGVSMGDALVLFVLLAANLVWLFVPAGIYMGRYVVSQARKPIMNENYIIRQLAIYAGNAAVWNGGLAIVFAVKENYLVKSVLGRQGGAYHNGLRFHVFLGVACLFQSIFHGSYFVVRYAVDSFDRSKDETVKIGKNPERTVTYNSGMAHMLPVTESGEQTFFGIIALLILVVQVGTAIFYVRRKNFRVFTWFHRIFFLFVFFAALHWGPASYYPIIAALLYLLLDRLSMHIRNNHFRSQITRVSSDIFRLDISVPNCVYAPGDWVTVKIPSLSWFEWHPFSIASYSPESPDKVTLFVRPRSRWTSRLVNLSGSSTVTVGGIYGARSTAYLEHKSIVFVVGGSGITPVIPYVRHHAATHGNKGQGIHLVWSVRMKEDAYAYSEFTQDLFTEGSSLQNVKVHLYVTQEKSIKEIVSERYVPLSDKAEKDTGDMNVILSKSVTAFMSEDSKALTTTTTTTTNNNNNNNNTEVMVVNINVDSVDTQKASPSASPSLGPSRLPGLILALLVFGGGFLGFCIARQFQPGVTTRVCRSDDAIYFSSTTQYFLCFYYYYAAPLYLPAIVGFGLGLIWIVLFRIFSSKKRSLVAAGLHKVSESDELLADPSNRPPIFVTGHLRPSILKVLEDILANEAVPPTAILAAGPEPLVIATQQAAVSKKRDALPLQLPLERCRKLLSTGFPFQKVLIYFFISLQIVLIANHEVTAYEVTAYVLRLG